jgi:hypothetical protein
MGWSLYTLKIETELATNTISGGNSSPKPKPVDPRNPTYYPKPENITANQQRTALQNMIN